MQCSDRLLCVGEVRAQIKGKDLYHGGRPDTMTRENVVAEFGWVATSSKRRQWLFVQDNADMSSEGKELYERLDNLGAHVR